VWGFESPLSHQSLADQTNKSRIKYSRKAHTKLNVTVTDQPQCKKQLQFEIPGELVRAETDKAAGELARQANVPGFRRGHVPKSVIKTRFKKELRDEVLSQLIPHSLGDAIKEKALKVLGQPSVDDMKVRDDETIDLTVTVEVVPEFELANYKGMPTVKRVYRVTDEEIEKAIDRLRNGQAELAPVEDRSAKLGDVVSANVNRRFLEESNAEGEPDTGSESQEMEVELGARGVLAEFTNAFVGANVGDTKEFEVQYPEDYKPERFAGKRVQYSAEITGIRVKELPELDDEFAQSVSEGFKTVDDLRQDIRARLNHEATHRTEDELHTALMDQLVERNRFEVPEVAVEEQMNSRLRMLFRQLRAQGMDPGTLKLDFEAMRESYRERAVKEVRGAFILDRIADVENLQVTDEEIDEEISRLAEGTGQSLEAMKARLTKDGSVDRLKEQVRHRKAVNLVTESADIRIEEVEGLGSDESAK
jgi:trigger factor